MSQNIVPIIICGLVALLALIAIWRVHKAGGGSTYVMETTEQVDGERTLLVGNVLAVFQYNLQKLSTSAPEAATSPDGQRSYININTVEGHIMLQFDWARSCLRLYYNYHTDDSSGYIREKLKIKHNAVDEIKLATFCHKIVDNEIKIIEERILHSDTFKNILMQTLKTEPAEEEGAEEFELTLDEKGGQ